MTIRKDIEITPKVSVEIDPYEVEYRVRGGCTEREDIVYQACNYVVDSLNYDDLNAEEKGIRIMNVKVESCNI